MSKRIICLVMALFMMLSAVWVFAEVESPATTGDLAGAEEENDPYKVGNIVTLGTYEQDNDPDNGPEPIEWIVLNVVDTKDNMSKKVDHRALLLSVYALDARAYHDEAVPVTWGKCALRDWLNDDFLNAAFNEDEQKLILKSRVDVADDQGNPAWDELTTGGGTATVSQDYVFLLSYREAYKKAKDDKKKELAEPYFADAKARECLLTDYAVAQGAWTEDGYSVDGRPVAAWWLRSPGRNQFSAAGVYVDDSVFSADVTYSTLAVRPAVWINLDTGDN